MDPLSISASITALLQITSTVIQYLNSVKGASEDRRRLVSELASVSGILFILQDQADGAKQGDQWSSTLQSLSVPEGPLAQFRGALERLSSKFAPPATRLKKLGHAIVWPFQKEEIKEILGSIERQKALFNLARQNDHILLSKSINDDVSLLHSEVEEVAKGVSRLQISQITSEHLKIIEWLDGPDPSTNYNKALKDRTPSTGLWFIESNEYADWIVAPRSLLWLHGIPGCGKTILSSTILENVLDRAHTKPDSAVLYFYFDFNDAEKQQPEKMIRSLICQLSMYCADSILHNLYSSYSNGRRQPSGEVLLNTLHQMMTSLGDIYVILDALDECAERDELLPDLEEVVSWEDTDLHLLITSRRETDIEETLTPLSDRQNRFAIQSARVDADIRTYIHRRLQIDRKLKRWQKEPNVQIEIEDTLTRKADGMFRWVACQLDSLRDCFDLLHLRQALKSLPKTLDDTYARILCNIDDHYNHYNRQILKILQWLTFSLRPLELKEIAEVFAIEVDQTPRFDPQRRMPEPRDMLTMCSSLITVTNNMHNTPEEEESGSKPNVGFQDPDGDCEANNSVSEDVETYVRLAHFSVKEYLLSDRIQHGAASYYSIREMKSHGVLAEDCIAYLLQFDEPGSLTSVTLGLSPLAQYAAMSWRRHARFAEEGLIKSTTLLAMELFMAEGEAFLNWIRIYNGVLDEQPENPGTPLYYASEGELFEPVRMLIEGGLDVNAKGGEAGNALTAASFSENIDIVHLLIINGADVNAQGGLLGNALQAGADADADNVVELLLKHGAEVNVVSGNYNTPLIAAISYGNENVVKLLLEKGADVKAGRYGSAVVSASKNGHENVVKLLLDKGADVNAPGDGLRALYAASVNGYENIVNLLLENGAEINDTSEYSGNALQAASANGHENIVKLLLEKKADVNALGYNLWEDARGYDSWGSALEAASYNGDENIVKLLLKEGADVNAVGDRLCGSALQAASDNGNENVVKMLLKKGADVNALGYYLWGNALPYYSWGTALQVASDNGYENIVKMLLEEGADVNVLGDGVLGSALYLASEQGHESIVKMLEAKGAVIVLPTEKRSEDEPKSEYSPAEHIEEPDPVEDLPAHSDASPALE